MRISLSSSIQDLPRIGPKTAATLKKMGIKTSHDALYYFPFRYEDFRTVVPIVHVKGNSEACVRARVKLLSIRRSPRKRMTLAEVLLEDATGSIKAIWFHQPYLAKTLHEGEELFIAGKVDVGKYGMQFVNPIFERVSDSPTHTARIVPVYSVTEGVSQKLLRSLIRAVLPLSQAVRDPLPESIRKKYGLMPLSKALSIIHFPITIKHAEQARERLGYHELVRLDIEIERKQRERAKENSIKIQNIDEFISQNITALPFTLTQSQTSALREMQADLRDKKPMNRLLNGDVGSGKTVLVHVLALALASQNIQSVFLVPTDILASQHAASLLALFPKNNARIAVFTRTRRSMWVRGKEITATKKEMLLALENGEISYVIGTHTLIQKNVLFHSLGLVAVDEQHRFGVLQRAAIPLATKEQKNYIPHFLSLTATPIPRSLARIVFNGGEVSILDQKPVGRKPISTIVLKNTQRQKAYDHIRGEIKKGRQAFVICPIIEESDTLGVKAATKEYELLSTTVFADLAVGLIHGKQKATQRDAVMQGFLKNKINILVATAVVEVGVDVPNATAMLIEGAERFGLAQLHQFRGRIGRGEAQSTCFAVQTKEDTKQNPRLEAFQKTNNGFTLSEFDLQQRGPGAIFGTQQSGFLPLKVADITNGAFVKRAQDIARDVLANESTKP